MIKFKEFWEKYRSEFIRIANIKFFGIMIVPKKARAIIETIVLAVDTALGLIGQYQNESIPYSSVIYKPVLGDIMVKDL